MVIVDKDRVTFRFLRPAARRVHLVGDFSGWDDGIEMEPVSGGLWEARLRLPAGTYRFKYVADGQWYADYASFGLQHGPHGPDSVVHVLS